MTNSQISSTTPPKKQSAAQSRIAEAPASVNEVLRSPGRPLDDATRAHFEPRFGQDFGHVRVHSDSAAAQSARSIHARAYTAGHHLAFASKAYAPETEEGRRLIAHELTHVLQQSSAAGSTTPVIQRSADDDLTNDWVRDLKEYVATHPAPYKHVIEIIRFARKYDLDDNVAADFAASQPLAQLENFASTAEGREMMDVLYHAMMTGSVSDYEKVQANKILYAKWKSRPAEVYKIAETRDPELPVSPLEGIINQSVNEVKSHAFNKRYGEVIKIINDAGDLDDDIASRFLTLQSPDRLEAYAASDGGRKMLDVLYQALITGDVTGFERLQADRILLAKAKTGKAPTTADVAKALDPPVFPLETSWGSTATIRAGLSDGKVKVYYDSRTGLGGSEFKTEREALYNRYDEKIYTGIILDPDELVIVKLFDQGGLTMPVPAIQLIDFFNQQKQDTLGKIKMVSVMAATVGLGGVGAPGVLGWADTIAFVTQAGNLIVQANRDVIAKTALGRDFLKAWDIAMKVSEYYGYVRMGVDGLMLVHATVVTPFKLWRDEVRTGLNSAEREGIAKVEQQTQEWLDSVERAKAESAKQAQTAEAAKTEAAEAAKVKGPGPAKTETAEAAKASPAGSQSATGISRSYPTNEDEILALNRARRRARPAYAKDPVPRKPGGTGKAGSSKPKLTDVTSSETTAVKESATSPRRSGPGSRPLNPAEFAPPPPPKTFREALDRVDINKIDPQLVAELRSEYRQNYSKKPSQPLKTEDDYVRFRGGLKSKQWEWPTAEKGEFQLYPELGRAHEISWSNISGSPRNPGLQQGGRFRTPWGNVEPDFAPSIDRTGTQKFAAAPSSVTIGDGVGSWDTALRSDWHPLLVADSKHFQSGIHGLTDQMRGFVWLAQYSESRALVIVGRAGDRLTADIEAFANQYGVKVKIREFGQ